MRETDFSERVLDWFDQHGRKNLPWQQEITPYRVWVSEIMLQQTQVATVLDYYQRFMATLPDLKALAEAPEDEVLHLWTGLGYYSRARNLHKTAHILMQQYEGNFPASVEQLEALPGIGRSTAGAIASIALGMRAPILDGNVKRVLSRHWAVEGYPGESAVARQLWDLAERLTPTERVNHYTQAMMDLGATLCTRTKPSCLLCPVVASCKAHILGREQDFPTPKPRQTVPQKHVVMPLLVDAQGCILLYRRPSTGLWGGLWSLPELESLSALPLWAQRHGITLGLQQPLAEISHRFSHFQLQIEPWLVQVEAAAVGIAEADWLWYNIKQPPRLGLAAPVKTLLKRVTHHIDQGTAA
ncbi:A/G-specific DNA-adenine glycosylase [Azomonas agilis]|uniref:Adenine DNA glycosylase n=1 Tax=Azomonas agilis TaxID=116849 RepID=A0A562I0W1_9GAMM|nr:A/G-specific adenine glycosylase [Azomonas agilis]TWH64660.1 A/G-specific DNA-adenine glycosylase [Azomonas agilis]